MSDGKLKSRPPTSEISLDDFLGAAGVPDKKEEKTRPDWWGPDKPEEEPPKPPKPEHYPWEAPSVREDLIKIFNLRLAEPCFLKLKYIADNTPVSMQKFCLDILLPAIDAKIEELKR